MRPALLRVASILWIIGLLSACNPPNSIGAGFLPDESYVFERTEEIRPELSTVFYDEVESREPERLIVGAQQDEQTGRLMASTYLQFGPEQIVVPEEGPEYGFDSLVLVLDYSGYFVGDTLQPLTLSLYRIIDEFEPDEDNGTFYTDSQLPTGLQPLTVNTILPRPRRGEPLEILLPPRLGREFFDKLLEGEEEITNATEFAEYFSGLAIRADSNSASIIGFEPEPRIELRYGNKSETPAEDLTAIFSRRVLRAFNRITTVRSETVFEALESGEAVGSDRTGDLGIIQGGSTLAIRVDLQDWQDYRESFGDAIITKAELRLRPSDRNTAELEELPNTISAAIVDEDNQILALNPVARLQRDLDFNRDTYYRLDATQFIKAQLNEDAQENEALLLTLGLDGNSATTLLLEDGAESSLSISYVKLKDN